MKDELMQEKNELFRVFTFISVKVKDQEKVFLFCAGLPIIQFDQKDDMVVSYGTFSAFSQALIQEPARNGVPLIYSLFRNAPSLPCPLEKLYKEATYWIDQHMDQSIYNRLRELTIDQLVQEAPKRNAVRNLMADIAIEIIARTIDPNKFAELPLKLGRRNVVITPILYDDEKDKYLFLLLYGSINNPVTLAAFWNDEKNKVRCDPKLSAYFNDKPDDQVHPWMQEKPIHLDKLVEYLIENPGVFDSSRAKARRKGLTTMVFNELKKWINPHHFSQTLFDCGPWLQTVPTFNHFGSVTTTYAMGRINEELELLKENAALKEQEQPSTLN